MNLSINITLEPDCELQSIVRTGRGWQVRVTKKLTTSIYPHYQYANLFGQGATIEEAAARLGPQYPRNKTNENRAFDVVG